ncbi:hypothetical protein LCGC14_2906310, partial [marine sediment metagenome]
MAAPTGIEKEIYHSPAKTAGKCRVKIRLDRPIMSATISEDFDDSSIDTDLWSTWTKPDTSITEAGTVVTLASTAETNAFPIMQTLPGKSFPYDLSIGWDLEVTLRFPTTTGFGVFFLVGDLKNAKAILAIKNNTDDGCTVELPDGTNKRTISSPGSAFKVKLSYTPIAGAT